MHMFEDIPGQAQDILATSENFMISLTCDDLEFPALKPAPSTPPVLACLMPLPSKDPIVQVLGEGLSIQESTPKRAPWLLSGMILMALDSYFPQLSDMSSLLPPLQAAIPVLHWMVSWWILPPGWEPNLVSLAPSLTSRARRERAGAGVLCIRFTKRCKQDNYIGAKIDNSCKKIMGSEYKVVHFKM
ncbi:hypothetical protein DSO57_1037901 [Entomophthora muscae]|uniref:Uncharacterized protein n=1 Tax=Entomophthora muscae TaxID=34485 RepID=A0ACC2RDJ4_9FUNG|nr:hypothetical protein DSO57_1037901 [Entomophthora muscae]